MKGSHRRKKRKWSALRAVGKSIAFESDDSEMEEKWVNELLAPGSSVGGARPKATMQGPDGSLWIAKLPSIKDNWNVGAGKRPRMTWLGLCSLNVPESNLALKTRSRFRKNVERHRMPDDPF
jgi:serine/threonine-protein kinase HipA